MQKPNLRKLFGSDRRVRQILRRFRNVCWVLHNKGMSIEERHNIFVECMSLANDMTSLDVGQPSRKNDSEKIKQVREDRQYMAQKLFVERMVVEKKDWFQGVRI